MSQLVRSPDQLGNALRRARRSQKITQAELARRAGLRQGTVSQVENGLETVRLSTVLDLMRALDLEILVQARSKSPDDIIEQLF